MNPETIIAALALLSADDDTHWTADGLPNADVVYGLLGNPAEIEKEQMGAYIQWAAQDFRRPVKQEAAVVTPSEEIEKVEEMIVDETLSEAEIAFRKVQAAEKAFNDAQKNLRAAQVAQDAVISAQEKEVRGNPIGDYLQRQKENLAKRAEKLKFISENGEIIRDLLKTKSPLDMSLSNRRRPM